MKQFQDPTFVANKGYSSIPIRQRKQFSSTIGHLLPVYYDYLQPGDKVTCGVKMFSRYQPMVAPPFFNVEEHIDWFFVPMEQIYSYFGDALYSIQDFKNDFVGASTPLATNIFPQFDGTIMDTIFYDAFRQNDFSDLTKAVFLPDFCVILRLLDCLGHPVKQILRNWFLSFNSGASNLTYPNIAVWLVGAYQKIWSDHYRLTDWQENNAFLYNFDSFILPSTSRSDDVRFKNCFTLHRVPYKRDYFTYILPSPIFNDASFNSLGYNGPVDVLTSVNQWLTNISSVSTITQSGAVNSVDNATTIAFNTSANQAISANRIVNPASLRTLFAMEKMLEVTRRAGKHYDAQTLSHFGINVPSGLSGECMFLGGVTSSVNTQDVFSTAQTDSTINGQSVLTPLGQMAGKAYSAEQKGGIRFEAKCHGVLMAIYYALPDIVYEQSGIDRLNSYVHPADFPMPELDNLGMQPLFKYEAYFDYFNVSAICGWKFRWSELKSKSNLAFGAFAGDMKPWTLSKIPYDYNIQSLVNWSSLTVDSTLLNQFMLTQYTGQVGVLSSIPDLSSYTGSDSTAAQYADIVYNQLYARDPLLHDFFFEVNKASKMSVYGLPSL